MDGTNTSSYRVILCGNSSVGKSSIAQRLVQNVFYTEHVPTLGVDFQRITLSPEETQLPNCPVSLNLWDSAGQENFLSITQQFIRGADAAFICYDITDAKSYRDAITSWRERIAKEKDGAINIILVGCKSDLEGMRAVTRSEAAAWAAENKVPFFETSAKENDNVRPTFVFVAKMLFEQRAAKSAQRGNGGAGAAAAGGDGSSSANKVVLGGRVAGPAGGDNAGGAGGDGAGGANTAATGGSSSRCKC